MDRLTDGLWYERETASASVVGVVRRATGSIEPVLRLRRGPMNGRRLHVDLVLLGGERSVEVSFHPAATVDLVRGHAQRRGHDANGWLGALLGAVIDDGRRWGSWTPAAPRSTSLAVLGGVTHPLLGAAYDAGVVPAPEVPRWASSALAEPSMAACALRLFGASSSNRSVVRALAELLVRPALAWWQLAACVALAPVVEADDVAAVLGVPAGPEVGPAQPTAADVAVLRSGLRLLGGTRAKRLAVDSLRGHGGEVGVGRLTRVLRTLAEVKDDLRWPPPSRLGDLETVCLRATAVDPAPRQPRQPAPPAELAPVRPPSPTWTTPRGAPATSDRPRRATDAFDYRPADRRLDHQLLGPELELVLPRTAEELTAWGRMLGNCLGDFGAAVAERRSVIVGVRERGSLVAALELRPNLREVVQFLGARNRVPPASVTRPVLDHLVLA